MSATLSDSIFGAGEPSQSGVPPGAGPLQAPRSLLARPPERVLAALRELGIDFGHVLLSTLTDIDHLGRYDPAWLIIAREKLVVVSDERAEIRLELALDSIREFRTQAGVGSGLLQAK